MAWRWEDSLEKAYGKSESADSLANTGWWEQAQNRSNWKDLEEDFVRKEFSNSTFEHREPGVWLRACPKVAVKDHHATISGTVLNLG